MEGAFQRPVQPPLRFRIAVLVIWIRSMGHRDNLSSVASLSVEHMVDVLAKLDDRAAAIMATSMLETFLETLIAFKFRRMPTPADDKLIFGGFGPLGTFSAKILIGYHIGAISADARHDLQIMKDIRNDFAHDFSPLSFSTISIADRCRSLKLRAEFTPGSHLDKVMPSGPRGNFARCFSHIVGQIVMQFAFLPHEHRLLREHQAELITKAKESFARRDFGQH